MYKASLIISVYKNITFLKAVLDSLNYQTENSFEIIITEDGEDVSMRDFISNYNFKHDYQHLTQEDLGWRKNKALNNAIRAAHAEWLIFIDGDCVLHPRFIEMHVRNAGDNLILAGKRVKLNEKLSRQLLHQPATLLKMPRLMTKNLLIKEKNLAFVEEGIFISPDGLFGWIPKMRKLNHLKGCNMSFSKKAIEAINGFDEDYVLPAVGEDADLTWRFVNAGFTIKSVRNMAVQYHLFHKENWTSQEENLRIMAEKQARNEFICKNGLTKISNSNA
jgi:cellulose synthase/poly-beta-1,6-N-acetylglucosamine synthase-like glycosyltransferase